MSYEIDSISKKKSLKFQCDNQKDDQWHISNQNKNRKIEIDEKKKFLFFF